MVSNLSVSAFFRLVDGAKPPPCLVIDELDTFFASGGRAEATGILNSGHNRAGAKILRSIPGDTGDWKAGLFSTWAPIVLASIGGLPPTLEDRSIMINVIRKHRGEKVERVKTTDRSHQRQLANRAGQWAKAHFEALRNADPTLPPCLYNRAQDN